MPRGDEDGPHGEIDWTTAAVRDGRLTVEIAGELSGEWSARVQEVAERLDRRALRRDEQPTQQLLLRRAELA